MNIFLDRDFLFISSSQYSEAFKELEKEFCNSLQKLDNKFSSKFIPNF